MTPVKLTNISTIYLGRPVAVATIRDINGNVLRTNARLAEQLAFMKANNMELQNGVEVLETIIMTLGFGA